MHGLRSSNWLRPSLIKLLDFISYSSTSHKSIFFIVFECLLCFLTSFLVNYLIIVKTFCDIFVHSETLIENILLLLVIVNGWNTSRPIFTSLGSNCLSRYDSYLVTLRNLIAWIRCNPTDSTDITRLLTSVSTPRLIWPARLSYKAAYAYWSWCIHAVFYILC